MADQKPILQRLRDVRDQTIDRLIEGVEQRMQDASYKKQGYTKVVYGDGQFYYEKILRE